MKRVIELRKRNGNKHIVSYDEMKGFAWAGYYTHCGKHLENHGWEQDKVYDEIKEKKWNFCPFCGQPLYE